MDNSLEQKSSLELLSELDKRYAPAYYYFVNTARSKTPAKRRAIVAHVKAAMKYAKATKNVLGAAKELKEHLIHDFWSELSTTIPEAKEIMMLLEDFAVIAVINPPVHQEHLQGILKHLVPEDSRGNKKNARAAAKRFLDYEYGVENSVLSR